MSLHFLKLLTTLLGAGMFAAAYALGRVALWRMMHRRGPRVINSGAAIDPAWIRTNIPLTRRLPDDELHALITRADDLLTTRHWHGCAGLDLTDPIRWTIAVQAALLVLKHPGDPYPRLREILVYPSAYVPRSFSWTPSSDIDEATGRLGESWDSGIVVLAWDAARLGTRNPFDAKNVILHEFAHQLDILDGSADGVPPLSAPAAYSAWTAMLAKEFTRHVHAVDDGDRTVLNAYGATQPAEFFAVATEAFFEKSRQLARKHPALYSQLQSYYQQDPAA